MILAAKMAFAVKEGRRASRRHFSYHHQAAESAKLTTSMISMAASFDEAAPRCCFVTVLCSIDTALRVIFLAELPTGDILSRGLCFSLTHHTIIGV